MTRLERRAFLGAVGGATVTSLAVGSARARRGSDGWRVAETPVDVDLTDVAVTVSGAYAVGGDGTLLGRGDDGWRLVRADGPTGNGKNLAAVDVTDDGERLWMVGASGVVGEYDVERDTLVSHSAPDDVTNNFTDVAVSGPAGDATVRVTDASGIVHVSDEDGAEESWTHVTPGSGTEIRAVDVGADGRTVLVDGNQSVFRSADGVDWTQIGIEDADHALADVDVQGAVRVAGGALYARADDGWTVANPTENALADIEVGACGCVHAAGADGTVLHRPGRNVPGGMVVAKWLGLWSRTSPTDADLAGIALGPPHVAVGEHGTVVER